MIPQGDYILKTVAENLITKYVPRMDSDNERAEMALMAFFMGVVSEEFDRAAHRRIEENLALKKLFSTSLPVVKDNALRTRLEEASKEEEADWRISSLDKSNCRLVELLIELHTHIETLDDENSQILEKAIWEEMKHYAGRREFMMWELSQEMLLAARKG